jgi:two-component system response regulator DegU
MKILIVDDNAGIRRVLRRTLADTASEFQECTDGCDALSSYEKHRPDLVLMDIRMTKMDGLTATKLIRSSDPTARIIVVTDYDDEDLRIAALKAGACNYVLKEELSKLTDIVAACIRDEGLS